MGKEFDRWRSMNELCEYIDTGRDTALFWIGNQNMVAHKNIRTWKIKLDEIDAWIKADGVKEA